MQFHESTQAKYWIFNEENLRLKKQAVVMRPQSFYSQTMSIEEEEAMKTFISDKMFLACAQLGLSHHTQGTALTFFHRFYLERSVLEYHPKAMMFTCIYLACKTEEERRDIKSMSEALPEVNAEEVLSLEYVLLDALKFHLHVYLPYHPLTGFVYDIQVSFFLAIKLSCG
eukprot:TRINITY_DN10668_c0_g1_i1.p1 TRINITY_DN10668_c0_g1~~TRINITY_DN10668_c0_g1_i1.p1  ORF type:complete len:185 (-),score=34.09 TRINITY_DN10668_c0_g1_i1:477-986(-)